MDIETFDNLRGGNTAYKALAHPVAADGLERLAASLKPYGSIAVYDPDGIANILLALAPPIEIEGIYVHDSTAVGRACGTHTARALTDLAHARVRAILIAAFDSPRLAARIEPLFPGHAPTLTLDTAKLPPSLLTNRARYLDPVNFATNFAFFRDDDMHGTRLTTANYWAAYGARSVSLFMRLYSGSGLILAEWQEGLPDNAGGFVLDSGDVRRRFGLKPFAGQLFIHAVGAAGHDIVKYALDVYSKSGRATLSCTHDANAWPAARYAGLPAPLPGERVILWVQNSHAAAIPAAALSLDRMGADSPVGIDVEIPAFATRAVDVSALLPGLQWPSQIEFRAGRHVVRPRYEIERQERTRIAHMNVERTDLPMDPGIKTLLPALGRGYLLPFPILPRAAFRTLVQPTPMTSNREGVPLRIDVFAHDGRQFCERFLGSLPRNHAFALDLDDLLETNALSEGGHAELTYDFRDGGEADGWLHALFRFEHRGSGHVSETSFGAHIFNTAMTYKNEPQSYKGPPPGLSTKLFLRVGTGDLKCFGVLIYPASAPWRTLSDTFLELHGHRGDLLASRRFEIPCSGSLMFFPADEFGAELMREAGSGGYALIRDETCRLFGYQGLDDGAGRFSIDHMFGF